MICKEISTGRCLSAHSRDASESGADYLNFVAKNVMDSDAAKNDEEVKGKQVVFTKDTPGVKNLFNHYNMLKTGGL
jgi:hypothetical protein